MQEIKFFDDPTEPPRPREDVRLKQLGLFVYEDGRRVAVGFDITPFQERPSIEVSITNANGDPAGTLTVIETLETNFNLTMHLRDETPTDQYEVEAVLYYASPEGERMVVDGTTRTFDASRPGDQTQ